MSVKGEYVDMVFNTNELFTFSYSCDALKAMMEFLYANQKTLIAKVSVLERQNEQQVFINPLNAKYGSIDSNDNDYTPGSMRVREKAQETDRVKEAKSTSSIALAQVQPKKCEEDLSPIPPPKDTPKTSLLNYRGDNQKAIDNSKLSKRLKALEAKVSSLQKAIQSIESHSISRKSIQDELNPVQVKCDIEFLKEKDTEIDTKLIAINSVLDELKVKVCDFDIYEIFKDTKTERGDVNISEALIQNLDQKTFKKFALIDDKIKQSEFDLIKSKKDLTNLKSQLESGTYTLNTQIDNLTLNQNHFELNQIEASNSLSALTKQMDFLNEQATELKEASQIETKELRVSSEALKKKLEGLLTQTGTLLANKDSYITEQQYLKLKDSLLKRLQEFDAKIACTNPIDKLKSIDKTIADLNETIEMKGNKSEIAATNEKLISILNQIDYLKEAEGNMTSSYDKIAKDITGLQNKLDLFQSWLETMKMDNSNSKLVKRDYFSTDSNRKYLDLTTFNEYMKAISKDKEKHHKEMEDLASCLNGVANELKAKANEIDMKRIEDYLMGTIDDLKKNIKVKYAEKLEINKRDKLIEQQIRYLMDSQMKKSEMGEKWLIAKKPVGGGHNCASCDSYLGDLNQSNEYIPWNKIPSKEPMDPLGYRIGNGFSRILSMVHVGHKEKRESLKSRDRERDITEIETEGENVKRKTINTVRKVREKDEFGLFSNEPFSKEIEPPDRVFSEDEPKIVKIYKKGKKNKSFQAYQDLSKL